MPQRRRNGSVSDLGFRPNKTMKKILMTMMAVLAMSASVQAKTVKATFKVSGGCPDMCKSRIEKAAKQVSGVTSAKWSMKTQTLVLIYDNTRTNPLKVQKALAAAGHDAGDVKAADAVYNKLPGCCKYRK